MTDRLPQHTGGKTKRSHLQLVEDSNVDDAVDEVFDDGQDEDHDESEPMPWDVSVEEEPSTSSPEPKSYRNKYELTPNRRHSARKC